jgi:hypothetical protein
MQETTGGRPMSHETTIVVHDWQGSTASGWDPPAVAHTDDALRQVRADPRDVERFGSMIDRELERRQALVDGASDAAPNR